MFAAEADIGLVSADLHLRAFGQNIALVIQGMSRPVLKL